MKQDACYNQRGCSSIDHGLPSSFEFSSCLFLPTLMKLLQVLCGNKTDCSTCRSLHAYSSLVSRAAA
uniref:Uncharacterized protein n=1 Tax=Aegilops tauschii subsp. strangulata TaxID=200361 RepID=A0A453MXY0_AEGTS